ncbi:hypothetical protein GQ53DRAFT_839651 [Thozetella sp. PMI_491]|nr:hypothetical protein GQ53DRAFT_839651 [Thozetella sp. PMI_491]
MSKAQAHPFVSNGTCYYASGQKADPAYIPCGNVAFGTIPCCQAGDFCLSNNACFNEQYGNVYLAGCTSGDTYNNEAACPRKYKLDNQQWVGMVRCQVSNDNSKSEEVWQGCVESVQPLNNIGDPCKCTTGLANNLYTKGPPDLPREALLPTAAGKSITFASGYGPSNTAVTATNKINLTELTAGATVTPQSGWTTLDPSATPTGGGSGSSGGGSSSGGGDSGLSTGAKAGIGVGVAIGAIAIISILWCLFTLNRRISRGGVPPANPETAQTPMSPAPTYNQGGFVQPGVEGAKAESPKAAIPQHPMELEGSYYPGSEQQGFHSELPAGNAGTFQAQMAHATPSPIASTRSPNVQYSPLSSSPPGPGHAHGVNQGGPINGVYEVQG